MQDLIGQTLDEKYKIRKELGRGGMGAVYSAVHLGTKRAVAVKVIVPRFMESAEFVERFRREAEAAGRLHHPNVVDVTDFGFARTPEGLVAYLVMEYLEGCTLGEILEEEKKLPLAWTVDIFEQVCSAVAEAHRQGIIHRDLKPDNIWLEPNQRGGYTAKVLDFGIAKLETQSEEFHSENTEINPAPNVVTQIYPANGDENATKIFHEEKPKTEKTGYETNIISGEEALPETRLSLDLINPANTPLLQFNTVKDFKATEFISTQIETDRKGFYEKSTAELTGVGAIMGTPIYMSPEQCRGERLGTSSDIYSLGVVAYQMLSGKAPFEGNAGSIITGHLRFPPPPLQKRKIPRKVRKVIHNALSKEPLTRPPTAEIFASQLRSYSENIITIFRRALVIFTENFSKLIWFSLLLYFPTILLGAATFFINLLRFDGFFSTDTAARISSVVLSGIKHLNIAAGVAAETLVTGAVAWLVIQYIDAPLRSFRVSRALAALSEKWKQFAWILPLRILINLLVQGDATAFSAPTIFLLSFVDSLVFWSLPCVVMLENLRGFAALKRGWKLTLKAVPTVLAAIALNLFIFSIAGISTVIVVYNVAAFVSQNFFPSVFELPTDEFNRLLEGILTVAVKLTGTILMPFFAVVTALIYLKTRHAGGESMRVLLDEFKETDVLQSNWQKRVRRRIEQSQRSLHNR